MEKKDINKKPDTSTEQPQFNKEQMDQYMDAMRMLQLDHKKASAEELRQKLNFIAKLKFQYYNEIESLSKQEQEINEMLKNKK